ncbi:hypothetical protein B7P43_G11128 [Cryptotermes secundus]|uniref:Uncharacterized protein n=1 Tax=Cryptotermes secundus TaxID=105785 RepID=A0A2J7QBC2_9NEOP|nr:hypothetical protein B7P43_G11128 [Cryptotermes secundus]
MQGSGGAVPPFLTLALDGRGVVSFTPGYFTQEENCPQYPLDRKLGGPQSRSGHSAEEKILYLLGIEPRLSSPQLYHLLYSRKKI